MLDRISSGLIGACCDLVFRLPPVARASLPILANAGQESATPYSGPVKFWAGKVSQGESGNKENLETRRIWKSLAEVHSSRRVYS